MGDGDAAARLVPPLVLAAAHGRAGAVRALLAAGADPNVRDVLDWTPLIAAAAGGRLACARLLLGAGADVGAAAADGWTALLAAALGGHAPLVRALIEHGAPLDAVFATTAMPLDLPPAAWGACAFAVAGGHTAALALLRAAGASLAGRDAAHYVYARLLSAGYRVEFGHAAWVHEGEFSTWGGDETWYVDHAITLPRRLLAPVREWVGAAVDRATSIRIQPCFEFRVGDERGEAAQAGASDGRFETWRALLSTARLAPHLYGTAGLPLAERSGLLAAAVERGLPGVVAALLRDTPPTEAALLAAAGRDDPALLLTLLRAGAAPGEGGGPLFRAVARGRRAAVEALLEAGASPAARREQGRTALHVAAETARPDIAALLLAHGARVDARDAFEQTPLLLAANATLDGAEETLAVLLAHGADPNRQSLLPATPLTGAAGRGAAGSVARLLAAGAAVNTPVREGRTALHHATAGYLSGTPAVVAALARAGADLEARDDAGQTPLHLAATPAFQHRVPVLDALLAAGANPDAPAQDGRTPLLRACQSHLEPAMECARRLVAAGARLDVATADGRDALLELAYWTYIYGSLTWLRRRLIEELVTRGGDPWRRDRDDRCALDYLSTDKFGRSGEAFAAQVAEAAEAVERGTSTSENDAPERP